MLKPVQATQLSALTGIKHGFFTRPGGVSTGIYSGLNAGLGSDDERSDVVENRQRMANWLGVTAAELATPYQVHSADAVATDIAWHDRASQGGRHCDQQARLGNWHCDC